MVPQYPWQWSAGVLAGFAGAFYMDLDTPREVAGPPEVTPVIDFEGVSKWYGNVIGLNKLTLRIPPGVTGLLGPNGARQVDAAATGDPGELRPSQGPVRVRAEHPWNDPGLMRSTSASVRSKIPSGSG